MYARVTLMRFLEQAIRMNAEYSDIAKNITIRALLTQCGPYNFSWEEIPNIFRGYEHLIRDFMVFAETPESRCEVLFGRESTCPFKPFIVGGQFP